MAATSTAQPASLPGLSRSRACNNSDCGHAATSRPRPYALKRAFGSKSHTLAAGRPSGFSPRERSRPSASTRAAPLPNTWPSAGPQSTKSGQARLASRQLHQGVRRGAHRAGPATGRGRYPGRGRHWSSRQLSLSAGAESPANTRMSVSPGGSGTTRCLRRVSLRSASTKFGKAVRRRAGPWPSRLAGSTRTRKSTL